MGPGERISYIAWVPAKPQFGTTCDSSCTKSLCLWSCEGDLVQEFDVERSRIGGCAFVPVTQRFIALGGDEIFVYDTNSWALMEKGSFDPTAEPGFVSSIMTRKKQQTIYGLFISVGICVTQASHDLAHRPHCRAYFNPHTGMIFKNQASIISTPHTYHKK